MQEVEFIIYVADQQKSKTFYSRLLQLKPVLDVPGMSSFKFSDTTSFGIMPESGIARILGDKIPNPATGNGIPRCELYLRVNDAAQYLKRGIRLGAKEISPLQERNWGDKAGYLSDPDGHIIAFAEKRIG